jgi:hypothetical protein
MAKSKQSIKMELVKQIKNNFPHYSSKKKKEKKEIIKQVIDSYKKTGQDISALNQSKAEQLGLIDYSYNPININDMRKLIIQYNRRRFYKNKAKKHIIDAELLSIEDLVDWELINKLLIGGNYTPGRRSIFPYQFFKAELLKNLKYPEISYRKYDKEEINNPERKQNRAFIGLKSSDKITHDQLSKFRSELAYTNLLNVLIYFVTLFVDNKDFGEKSFNVIDSTEIAEKISSYPLHKEKINGETIRFYNKMDADLGVRRKKRDKSTFFVGYRMHTLTIVDPETQEAYPLLSILSPANHHDSQFLKPILELAKTIGLEIKLIVGDQAYGSEGEYEEIESKYDVLLLNTPKEVVSAPEFVNKKNGEVYKDALCSFPMTYIGRTENNSHEFHCNACSNTCPFDNSCSKVRFIKVDSGLFGPIPFNHNKYAKDALKMRKVAERPFNLIKHRDGLEPLRTHGIVNSTFVALSSNISTLLIELAGYRKKKKKNATNVA